MHKIKKIINLTESIDNINLTESIDNINLIESIDNINLTELLDKINSTELLDKINSTELLDKINLAESIDIVNLTESIDKVNLTESIDKVNLTESIDKVNLTESIDKVNLTESIDKVNSKKKTNASIDDINISLDKINISLDKINISTKELNILKDELNILKKELNISKEEIDIATEKMVSSKKEDPRYVPDNILLSKLIKIYESTRENTLIEMELDEKQKILADKIKKEDFLKLTQKKNVKQMKIDNNILIKELKYIVNEFDRFQNDVRQLLLKFNDKSVSEEKKVIIARQNYVLLELFNTNKNYSYVIDMIVKASNNKNPNIQKYIPILLNVHRTFYVISEDIHINKLYYNIY
jgi:hypothetical protein